MRLRRWLDRPVGFSLAWPCMPRPIHIYLDRAIGLNVAAKKPIQIITTQWIASANFGLLDSNIHFSDIV